MQHYQHEAAVGAFPVGVVTANHVFGIAINDLVLWATLVYVLIQISIALPKLFGIIRNRFKRKDSCNDD